MFPILVEILLMYQKKVCERPTTHYQSTTPCLSDPVYLEILPKCDYAIHTFEKKVFPK
jgi:hypothetical protein